MLKLTVRILQWNEILAISHLMLFQYLTGTTECSAERQTMNQQTYMNKLMDVQMLINKIHVHESSKCDKIKL
jgi:hypothetical protein